MKTLSKIAFCLSLCLLGNQAFAKDKLIVWEADQNGIQALTKVAKEFENRYDCEIELSQYDSVHQIEKVIELNSKNERSPDVFILTSDKLGMAIHENAVSPLEFMNEDHELYLKATADAFKLDKTYYASPRSVETLVVYYNKDVVEYPFETFNEYIDYSKKHAGTGKYGLLAKFDNFYFSYGILSGYGAYIFGINADGSYNRDDVGLNFNNASDGLSMISDFAKNYMPKAMSTDEGWELMDELFIKGKAAAVINGPWSLQKYAQAGVNYGIAPLPLLSNGKSPRPFFGCKGYVVNEKSENKTLAKKFIQVINEERNAVKRYEVTAELPPLKTVLSNPLILNDDFATGIAIQSEKADPMPSIKEMGHVWQPINDALYQAILSKNPDTKKLLDTAVENIKAQYDK